MTKALMMDEIKLRNASDEISKLRSLPEIKAALEATVGMETIFTMLSTGWTVEKIAEKLEMDSRLLESSLSSTNELKLKYLQALAFRQAINSAQILSKNFSDVIQLDQHQDRAAKHHRDILKQGMETINKASESNSLPVLNITTVVSTPLSEQENPDIEDGELIDEEELQRLLEEK